MENSSIELFKVIYEAHKGMSMEYISEELAKAKIAIAQSEETFKNFMDNYDYRLSVPPAAAAALPEKKEIKLMFSKKEVKESIQDDKIICCICGKEFQSLGAHLKRGHHVTAEEYIKACDFEKDTVLMSRNYYEKSKQNALRAYSSIPRKKNEEGAGEGEDMDLTDQTVGTESVADENDLHMSADTADTKAFEKKDEITLEDDDEENITIS